MAPQHQLEKAAWQWAEDTDPDKVSRENVETAYRVRLTACQGTCRRNCKGNPHCLVSLGEKEWLGEIPEENWHGFDDPNAERRIDNSFVGLKNLGATCYVNCLLQLWFHNPALRKAIYQWKPEDDPQESKSINTTCNDSTYSPSSIVGHLQVMFALLQFSSRRYVDPSELINSLGINATQQQDAQEFSKLFMNLLEDQLQYQKNSVRRIMEEQFRGEYAYVTTCSKCNHNSTRSSKFYELNLNIKGHKELHESIEEVLQEERLEDVNQYLCSQCQSKQNATRKMRLLQLPPVLNLQLLRFVFDRNTGQKKKLNSYIRFPESLDMSKYVDHTVKASYDLSAVLIHRGLGASSGHYIAHIKDRASGSWYKFNDETIERMEGKNLKLGTDEETEEANKKDKMPRAIKGHHASRNAYMLVYTERSVEALPCDGSVEWDIPERVQSLVVKDNSKFDEWVTELALMREENVSTGKAKQLEIRHLYQMLPVVKNKPYEWVKTQWLIKWLSGKGNPGDIDHSDVVCCHDRLDPGQVTQMKCISHEAANILFDRFGGKVRLRGSESLCNECIAARCRLIRIRARVRNDHKFISDVLKKELESDVPAFWIGRESLRSWRRFVLQRYESTDCDGSENGEGDAKDEEATSLPTAFNHDIVCDHLNLVVDTHLRRLVHAEVWKRLTTYFDDAPKFNRDCNPCAICEAARDEKIQLRQQYRLLAAEQRSSLSDLYLDRNRPVTGKSACGVKLYALSAAFLRKWRLFVRDPGRYDPPTAVDNGQLLCPHDGLGVLASDDSVALVWASEWDAIGRFFRVDREVTIVCRCSGATNLHPNFVSEPGVCGICYSTRLKEEELERLDFVDAKVFVRKVNEGVDDDPLDDQDAEFLQVAKKKKLDEATTQGVRRSTRHRRTRGERVVVISSSDTLRELKLQIMKEFAVAPFDQHLSVDGRDLTDNQATLATLRVLPGSLLLLKADEAHGASLVEEDKAPEEGFKGTRLLQS